MAVSIFKTIREFFFPKKADLKVIEENKYAFIDLLPSIEAVLKSGNHLGQAKVIAKLMANLDDNNYEAFLNELHSVNMWGGSGAVWEVGFKDEAVELKFAKEMIKLIDLMKYSGIDIYRSNSVKRLFVKQLST